jgi:hypothetical protein
MRADLRQWRLTAPLGRFKEIRKKFDDAGIDVFGYVMTFAEDFPDEEIDVVFRQAQALGVNIIGTNQTTVGMAPKLVPYAEKYKMTLSFHNHAKSDDANEVASPESYEKLFGMSKYFKANLDIGHFTAGNNDGIAFIEKHHDRITHMHLKDRKRNDGPNMPWGEGETPLKQALTLIKEKHYPIYRHRMGIQGPGTPSEETKKKCMALCARRQKGYNGVTQATRWLLAAPLRESSTARRPSVNCGYSGSAFRSSMLIKAPETCLKVSS